MKRLIPIILLISATYNVLAQVGISETTITPDPSSILDLSSNSKGLLIPRMTETQRNAILTPAEGLMIFQTNNTSGYYYYNGTSWVNLGGVDTDWSFISGTTLNSPLYRTGNVSIGKNTNNFPLDVETTGNTTAKFVTTGNNSRAYLAISNDFSSNYDGQGININGLEIGVLGLSSHTGSPSDNVGIAGYSNGFGGHFENTSSGDFVDLAGTSYPIRIEDASATISSGMVLTSVDANGNAIWQTPSSGDITSVTAGVGLTGGGTIGAITLNIAANNGLNVDATADRVQLGGVLTETTTISQSIYSMIYNLNSTGDFLIRDNGVNRFAVLDNGRTTVGSTLSAGMFNVTGNSFFSDDIYLRDGSVTGANLIRIYDSADDGVIDINEGGIVNHRLHGNGVTVFNEQGLDNADFRIESGILSDMFFVDAGNNRIGIGTDIPSYRLHLENHAVPVNMFIRGRGLNGDPVDAAIIFDDDGAAGASYNGAGIFYLADYGSTKVEWFSGRPSSLGYTWTSTFGDSYVVSRKNLGTTVGHDVTTADPSSILMRITSNGNMGLGVAVPGYRLQLPVNSAAKPSSSAWTVASDERLKQNIKPFEDGLSTLLDINPVYFEYNGTAGIASTEHGVGTIAQDLLNVAPYMVKEWTYEDEEGKTNYLGVDYGAMDFILVNSVKELNEKVTALENQNLLLMQSYQMQKEKAEKLEAMLKIIEKKMGLADID